MDAKSTDVISRLETAVSAWSEELQSAHLDLERRLADAASKLANDVESELFDSASILDAVEASRERMGEVQHAVEGVASHTRELEDRLVKLEESMQGRSSLEETVAELQSELSELRQADGVASMRAEIEALREQIANAKPADEALVKEFAKVGMEVSQLRSALKEIGITHDRGADAMEQPESSDYDDLVVLEDDPEATESSGAGVVPFGEGGGHSAEVDSLTDEALKRLAFDDAGHRRRLGDILTAANAITEGQLDEALERQSRIPTSRIGTILVELGAATELTIARVLSAQLQLPYVELAEEAIEDEAVALMSPRLARHHQCMPVRVSGDTLVLAMANPLDLIAIEDVELATRKRVDPVVATQSQVAQSIETFYGPHVEMQDEDGDLDDAEV